MKNLKTTLESFLRGKRWFMGKNRVLKSVYIRESVSISPESRDCFLWLLEVRYRDNHQDFYLLPVRLLEKGVQATLLLKTRSGEFHEAFGDADFLRRFLKTLWNGIPLPGKNGKMIPKILYPFPKPRREIEVSGENREQSNSSLLFPGLGFLKLFRRQEPGAHPEAEMNAFLQRKHFPSSAKIYGSWTYRTKNESWMFALLQEDLSAFPNAWDRFKQNNTPVFFVKLGSELARMHLALSETKTPAFRPQKITRSYLSELLENIRSQARETQKDIETALLQKTFPHRKLAENLCLHLRENSEEVLSAETLNSVYGKRIRIHGDLHLGQILYRKPKLYFIDFEGEPARPLKERRIRQSPLKDVAGLLRSFDYARAFFKTETRGYPEKFLEAYFQTIQKSGLLSGDSETNRKLLGLFVLEKALYEVRYELANRPDWFEIPGKALLELLTASASGMKKETRKAGRALKSR
ncbi:MAG: phosphotransferase [Fibrobacter sp.]|jgi:predicted trehalose synthase|nr:phosphotransferase [Fibrobacter sp.]